VDKTRLDVPYISQFDQDASTHSADCGPTCVAMIINAQPTDHTVTVDGLYQHLPPMAPGAFTFISDLITIGEAEDVSMERVQFTHDNAIARTKELIEDGTPFIALVNYAAWDPITHNNFHSGHFVVVTGIDDEHVYVHDPIFQGSRRDEGEYYAWTYDLFLDGWGTGHAIGNPDYVGVVPEKTVNFVDGD
jgi:ABC-type bacteriocin/lantibiotic exporter with double-glycine peptidase domain